MSGYTEKGRIDWLSFTLPVADGVKVSDVVERLLRWFPDCEDLPRAALGYSHAVKVLGTGRVLWAPDKPNLGVHCDLPASALEMWELSAAEVAQAIINERGHATRIDVAVDNDQVSVDDVINAYQAGRCITRLQEALVMADLRKGGKSIYLGSASGRRRVRFYDKLAESEEAGERLIWTRCEVVFRQDQAQIALGYVASGKDSRELVASAVDFRLPDADDSNRTRWQRLDWWERWLGSLNGLSFVVAKVSVTVERLYSWVVDQVGPTLAMLSMAFGNTDWMADVARANFDRGGNNRWYMIGQYLKGENCGLQALS